MTPTGIDKFKGADATLMDGHRNGRLLSTDVKGTL